MHALHCTPRDEVAYTSLHYVSVTITHVQAAEGGSGDFKSGIIPSVQPVLGKPTFDR